MRTTFMTAILALVGMFGTILGVCAQDPPSPDPEQQDPAAQQYPAEAEPYSQQQAGGQQVPGQDQPADEQRSAARLSIVQGDVNVKRGDSGDLVAAVVNAPLLAQDHVQTSTGSRAEVQLDYANMIRLAPNTDVGFADLEYHRYQIQLGAGSIIYRVLRASDAQAEVDTPSIAVRPTQQGDYRISVLDDGSTQISVRSGELEVYSPRGTQRIDAGQTMLVRGDSSDPEFQMTGQIASDQFDDWSANRDRQLLASQSYQHVSPDIYGADDLDAYGNWVPSQYGNVWEPRSVGADWAPYSTGHWVWEGYYGWTWVDDAPWGWAPYHYGRWFNNPGYGWCWWPGSIASSYFWSPAVVGFFGWGGFGVGVGFGEIGWVALAPFEVFHPWWGHGFYGGGFGRGGFGGGYRSYTNITNINIVRNTNITNIYRNASVKGGVVACPSKKFGQPNQKFGRASTGQLRNASLFKGRMPVTPTQASRQFSNRQARANPRLASVASRHFYQGPQLPRSTRASSAQQQMRTQPGSRVGGNAATVARAGGFARTGQPGFNSAQRGQAPIVSRGGASTVPQNSRTAGAARAATPQASAQGWHRFGDTAIQRGQQIPASSRGSFSNAPQNSRTNRSQFSVAPQNSHGVPPNLRSQPAARGNYGAPARASASDGWHRFGEPGNSNAFRGATQAREQSGWHSFGQPQRTAPGTYGGARSGSVQPRPAYGGSFTPPNYRGGNYQSRPLGANPPAPRPPQSSPGYRGGYSYGGRPSYAAPGFGGMGSPHSAPSMPHYNAPAAPHYNAPAAPHYGAPAAPHYSAPAAPHYSAPAAPHFSAPRGGGGGGGFHGGGAPRGGGSPNGGHSSSGGRRNH
jgi:hypothetical protein